jgi:hypothetical protein
MDPLSGCLTSISRPSGIGLHAHVGEGQESMTGNSAGIGARKRDAKRVHILNREDCDVDWNLSTDLEMSHVPDIPKKKEESEVESGIFGIERLRYKRLTSNYKLRRYRRLQLQRTARQLIVRFPRYQAKIDTAIESRASDLKARNKKSEARRTLRHLIRSTPHRAAPHHSSFVIPWQWSHWGYITSRQRPSRTHPKILIHILFSSSSKSPFLYPPRNRQTAVAQALRKVDMADYTPPTVRSVCVSFQIAAHN